MKPQTEARDHSQNFFKAFLVIGMIIIHCLQLLTQPDTIVKYFSTYINLVTFSGFMFSFGYVYQLVYRSKEIGFGYAWRKMRSTLFAYYFSAIAWSLLVKHELSTTSLLKIFLLFGLLPYSEFLVAFFLTTGFYFLLKKRVDKILENGWQLLMAVTLLLLCCAVPYLPFFNEPSTTMHQVVVNYTGLLVGAQGRSYYPVLPYFSLFLLGGWFQRQKTGFSIKMLVMSFTATLLFFSYIVLTSKPPARFPPIPLWITGSFFFLYMYFLVARATRYNRVTAILNSIGENTLVYLVISNVLIFSLIKAIAWTTGSAILCGVMILVFISFIIKVARKTPG